MLQSSPTFTPPEILLAGRKAEAEGRLDYAVQFYRHLSDYYARTPEAAEARDSLQRLNAFAAPEPRTQPGNGYEAQLAAASTQPVTEYAQPSAGWVAPQAPARTPPAQLPVAVRQRRRAAPELPAPPHGYRIGRALAVLVMVFGWLTTAAGAALLAARFIVGFEATGMDGMSGMMVWPGIIVMGLLLILAGEVAHAIFRMTNATSDLAAMTRARAGGDDTEE